MKSRRSGLRIMISLIAHLGSLTCIMALAVIGGSLGYLCAMGMTLAGAAGIAKAMGASIPLSYNAIIALAIALGIMRGLLRYGEQYSNHYIAFRLLAVLRDKIFGALSALCPAKLECKQKGNIIAMITSDIETLEVFYAHTISPICIAIIVSLIVFLFIGCASSWLLATIALIGYIAIGILIPIASSKKLKEPGIVYRNELATFNAYFLDSIKGLREILLYNAEAERKQEVNRRSDSLLSQTRRIKRLTTRCSALTELSVAAIIIVSLIAGILLVQGQRISVGDMIIGVVAIFGSFGPVIAISALPSNLTQTFAAGDRILSLLAERPLLQPVKHGIDINYRDLDVKNLTFGYDAAKPILQDINLHAKRGEIVGISGESGSGKSTILKLLMRFWKKNEGKICYNNEEIDNINTDSLLSNVTLVSQSTYLFDDTIEENLRIAKPNATREEIENACKKASVHDFIMKLPQGYSTHAGILGGNLSAGEKQRIGLARAFLSGAELILLDEPTSNVDSINESIILRSIKEQRINKSIILVSHRESTMAIADRVYYIENGKIFQKNIVSRDMNTM